MTKTTDPQPARVARLKDLHANVSDHLFVDDTYDIFDGTKPCPKYAAISTDCDERCVIPADTLDEAIDILNDEANGEVSWEPVGIIDLDTGETIHVTWRVIVRLSGDSAA